MSTLNRGEIERAFTWLAAGASPQALRSLGESIAAAVGPGIAVADADWLARRLVGFVDDPRTRALRVALSAPQLRSRFPATGIQTLADLQEIGLAAAAIGVVAAALGVELAGTLAYGALGLCLVLGIVFTINAGLDVVPVQRSGPDDPRVRRLAALLGR